jgi:hypothetical protein
MEFLCPLIWSVHHNLARDGYIESTCCCVQIRFAKIADSYSLPLLVICYSLPFVSNDHVLESRSNVVTCHSPADRTF